MLKITWEGKVGPKLLKSFKAVFKKSHKSLNNNLVTMHSLPETFQTTRFWNWSLFPLWFWGLESIALWGPGRRFSDIGELKSFHAPSVFRPADKSYPFSPTNFSYLQCCRGFAGVRALTGTGDRIPPFSHAVLVTAAWLEQLSHKPETLTKTQAYQGPHYLVLTGVREYFGEASMEAQAHTILKTLTTSSYTPLVYQYPSCLWY